jgi:hypothetical protein
MALLTEVVAGREGEPLMRVFRVAAMIALWTGPAFAQMPNLNLLQDNTPAKTQEQKEQEEATDKAYKESLKKIPNAKASNDPWGGVRSPDAAKAPPAKATTATKAKTKTSSTPN